MRIGGWGNCYAHVRRRSSHPTDWLAQYFEDHKIDVPSVCIDMCGSCHSIIEKTRRIHAATVEERAKFTKALTDVWHAQKVRTPPHRGLPRGRRDPPPRLASPQATLACADCMLLQNTKKNFKKFLEKTEPMLESFVCSLEDYAASAGKPLTTTVLDQTIATLGELLLTEFQEQHAGFSESAEQFSAGEADFVKARTSPEQMAQARAKLDGPPAAARAGSACVASPSEVSAEAAEGVAPMQTDAAGSAGAAGVGDGASGVEDAGGAQQPDRPEEPGRPEEPDRPEEPGQPEEAKPELAALLLRMNRHLSQRKKAVAPLLRLADFQASAMQQPELREAVAALHPVRLTLTSTRSPCLNVGRARRRTTRSSTPRRPTASSRSPVGASRSGGWTCTR